MCQLKISGYVPGCAGSRHLLLATGTNAQVCPCRMHHSLRAELVELTAGASRRQGVSTSAAALRVCNAFMQY